MRILVVEDDLTLLANITHILTRASYAVDTSTTLSDALTKSSDESYDAFIIDWMLPDGEGPYLVSTLRSEGVSAPILMLTARKQAEDTVAGLDAGADDYITKPFTKEILLARLRSILRRMHTVPHAPIITISDLSVDTNTHKVTRGGKEIILSPKEYALLYYLVIHRGKAVDRITLLSHVWDEQTDVFSNTVDVHIRYLRKKIDAQATAPLLHTVKGKGYMICD